MVLVLQFCQPTLEIVDFESLELYLLDVYSFVLFDGGSAQLDLVSLLFELNFEGPHLLSFFVQAEQQLLLLVDAIYH